MIVGNTSFEQTFYYSIYLTSNRNKCMKKNFPNKSEHGYAR